jgi:zinc transporter ZupT
MSYALQIGAVVFGLAMIGLFNFSDQKSIKMLLAFSGSYLFSIVLLHFLPELYQEKGATIGLVVLAGFLLQILLDFYSTGLEHGHFHTSHFKAGVFPLGAIIGLFAHAFFEGLPIELQHSEEGHKTMLIAIILHKVPITVVLYALLNSIGLSRKKMWTAIILFAVMSPLGTLIGALIPAIAYYSDYLTAFAVGIFLHVSTTILFESSHNHRYNLTKLLVVVLGMALAYFSLHAV